MSVNHDALRAFVYIIYVYIILFRNETRWNNEFCQKYNNIYLLRYMSSFHKKTNWIINTKDSWDIYGWSSLNHSKLISCFKKWPTERAMHRGWHSLFKKRDWQLIDNRGNSLVTKLKAPPPLAHCVPMVLEPKWIN